MKKKLTMCLSVALIAVMVICGTLAYLTSEDGDVNVMALGNVEIKQHEYQRVENENGTFKTDTIDYQESYVLEDFEQGKPLLPIVGDPSTGAAGWDETTVRMSQVDSYGGMQVFAGKNAQDKFVTVENTGKTDAYVRTLVAIETGSANPDLIGTSYHQTWTKNEIGKVEIGGNTYFVIEYVYAGAKLDDGSYRHENGVLPADETTYPNLSQVYLKSVATNEDCEAIDGNGNGTLDILVLSQAVQAAGFDNAQTALDTAFGKVKDNVAIWFNNTMETTTIASTEEELKEALKTKSETVILTPGTYNMDGNFSVAEGVKIVGSEGTVLEGTLTSTLNNVEVKNVTFKGGNAQRWAYAKGSVVFEDCTFDATSVYAIHFDGTTGADITYKNCDITGWVAIAGGHNSLTFDGCRIYGNGTYGVIRTYSDATIKNCTFDVKNVNTTDVYQDGIHAVDCTINVIDCKNVNGEVEDLFNVSGTGVVVEK